jgi:hypothetical protein
VPLTVAASGSEHGNLDSHASGERSSSALSRKSLGTVGEVAAPGRESACPRCRWRATGRTERGSAFEAYARADRAMWNEVREMVQAPRGGSVSAGRPRGERVRRALRARPRVGIPRQAAEVGEESGLGPAADDRTIGEARGDTRCTQGDTEGRHGAGATRWRRSLRARSVFGQPWLHVATLGSRRGSRWACEAKINCPRCYSRARTRAARCVERHPQGVCRDKPTTRSRAWSGSGGRGGVQSPCRRRRVRLRPGTSMNTWHGFETSLLRGRRMGSTG